MWYVEVYIYKYYQTDGNWRMTSMDGNFKYIRSKVTATACQNIVAFEMRADITKSTAE